jgi:hypothetical protein
MKNAVYDELLEKARDIAHRKNSNYTTSNDPMSNFRECEKLGIKGSMGIAVRISDKYSRVCQLIKGTPDMVNESLEDTLLDMANYCLLLICKLRDEQKPKK